MPVVSIVISQLQGDPELKDEAAQVEPNCDKLARSRAIYQDLTKYIPYLSLLAREHWEQFKSANPTTFK